MKGSLLLLLLFVFLSLSHAQQKIGFKTTVSWGGISYMKQIGLAILESKLSSISIPDITGDASTPIGHVSYDLSKISLTGLTIPTSNITLIPPNSGSLAISNTEASMTLNWHYREDSFPHISGSGSADVKISETTIDVEISVGESGGRPTANTDSCKVDIGKLDITVHGGASWFYNWFVSMFSGQIKSAVESALQSQLPTNINQGLNSALGSLPITEPINSKVELNYELVAPPVVTPYYFTLYNEGEFFDIQNPQESPFSPSPLPDSLTAEMVQMFISEYTANSASFVFYSAGQMQYTVTDSMLPANFPFRLNTTYFTELIPPLQKAYPNSMFNLFVYAAETPTIQFSPSGAAVIGIANVEVIIIPTNKVAFTLGVKIICDGEAALSGMNVTGHLTFVNATISLVNSTIGTFDVTVLQSIIDTLVTALVIPQGNKLLAAGFPLPTVTGLTFVSPIVGYGNGYAYVSTNINYQPQAAVSYEKTVTISVV